MLLKQRSNPIAATQRWMEEFIVAKGVCPPFVRLAKGFKTPGGAIDWERFSQSIVIEDATHLTVEDDSLLPFLLEKYLTFLEQANNGTAPMALNIALPDFEKNEDFEYLVRDVKIAAFLELTTNTNNADFTKELFRKTAEANKMPPMDYFYMIQSGPFEIGEFIVEGSFNPVFFHGKPLNDDDVADFPDNYEPQDRFRVLSRAPYYILQFLNVIGGSHLSANLNRDTMHDRNNDIVTRTPIPTFESYMGELRGAK